MSSSFIKYSHSWWNIFDKCTYLVYRTCSIFIERNSWKYIELLVFSHFWQWFRDYFEQIIWPMKFFENQKQILPNTNDLYIYKWTSTLCKGDEKWTHVKLCSCVFSGHAIKLTVSVGTHHHFHTSFEQRYAQIL